MRLAQVGPSMICTCIVLGLKQVACQQHHAAQRFNKLESPGLCTSRRTSTQTCADICVRQCVVAVRAHVLHPKHLPAS